MKLSKGQANPGEVNKLLAKKIKLMDIYNAQKR